MTRTKTNVLTKTALLSLVAILASISTGLLATNYLHTEKVISVVDGDTFFIEANHQAIRVYGIDAPELKNCLGPEAKKELSSLILNKRVELREPLTDSYGRIMALVYVNGKLVNEEMIRNGFGVYRRQGGSETANLKAANDYARQNKIGIFSPKCYQLDPPDLKCLIKGNHLVATGAMVYLRPDCAHYTAVVVDKYLGDDWFCTEKQAVKAGYSKSPNCH